MSVDGAQRIFLLYVAGSDADERRALEIADRLHTHGHDAIIDRHIQPPRGGWPSWVERQIKRASVIVLLCSDSLRRSFDGAVDPETHLPSWPDYIAQLCVAPGVRDKIIPVSYARGPASVPTMLRSRRVYQLPREFAALLQALSRSSHKTTPGGKGPLPASARRRANATSAFAQVTPLEQLFFLLTTLFSASELRRWIRYRPGGELLSAELPAKLSSKATVVHAAVQLLHRHNRIDEELFHALKGRFPRRAASIDRVRARWSSSRPVASAVARPVARSGSDDPIGVLGLKINERFQITELLGVGGMSVVYRGRDLRLQRPVAIKFLSPSVVSIPKIVDRFRQECHALCSFGHPNIVMPVDFGVLASGAPYLAMEYLPGRDLSGLLAAGRLPWPRARAIIRQIIAALAYIHARGVIHRDLKPANCRVSETPSESVKLIDFGIAKVVAHDAGIASAVWRRGGFRPVSTQLGQRMGTPLYWAPEQASGERVDHRVDIYSLGVLIYELIAGALPPGPLHNLDWRAGLPEGTSPRLVALIGRATRRNPDERFASIAELRAEFDALDEPLASAPTEDVRGRDKAGSVEPDVTAALQRREPEIEVVDVTRGGEARRLPVLYLSDRDAHLWVPTSESSQLTIGPGNRVSVGANGRLVYSGRRRARCLELSTCPAEFTIETRAPLRERVTILCARGQRDSRGRSFVLDRRLRFRVSGDVSEQVLGLLAPANDSALLLCMTPGTGPGVKGERA